jgi:DNA-binding transcriptional LysR family regulator
MTRRFCFSLALVFLLAVSNANGKHEEKFVVIVNPSNHFDALSRSKLSFLYLRKVSRWPWGAEVDPIDLRAQEPARRQFTRDVLGTTEEQLAQYWIDQRITRGVGPPTEARDVAAAKAMVAAHPGAIAYIPESAVDNTVKVIRVEP